MTIYSGIISLSQFILPLPIVHTINSSGVIFVFIIDYFINGIQINKRQAIGITIGLIGVLVVGNQRYLK
jgi:drug/metabolite transporter (DMT)-like permease